MTANQRWHEGGPHTGTVGQ